MGTTVTQGSRDPLQKQQICVPNRQGPGSSPFLTADMQHGLGFSLTTCFNKEFQGCLRTTLKNVLYAFHTVFTKEVPVSSLLSHLKK